MSQANTQKVANRSVMIGLVAFLAGWSANQANGDLIYGTTNNNFLISWQSSSPQALQSGVAITGLQMNEQIIGLDARPRTGALFGVGSSNRLYTISETTGVAVQVGAPFSIPLNGSLFGFDFNPTIDRSRVVSDTRRNYVINPDNAVITQATNVFYAAGDINAAQSPNIIEIAYNNNVDGATTSQLFGIDSGLDILATLANSAGTLNTRGPLGIDISGIGGFDVSGESGMAFAALIPSGSTSSSFYQINLTTGAATPVGRIGAGTVITAMTVLPTPEPSSALLVVSGLGCLARRSRSSSCSYRKVRL